MIADKDYKLPLDRPRLFAAVVWALGSVLGLYAAATICAETLTPKTRPYSFDPTNQTPVRQGSALSNFASSLVPFRGDLLANVAFASAGPAVDLLSPKVSPATNPDRALKSAEHSLAAAPHASDVWLLLAALQETNSRSRLEALKMSFLTAPGDAALMPGRLLVLATSSSINDPDLQSLARGEIRLILTRRPDLKPSIIRAYRSGTPDAKAFLADVTKSLDIDFAGTLPRE